MIEIIDDFLTSDEFNQIYNLVSDLEFPWFFVLLQIKVNIVSSLIVFTKTMNRWHTLNM